MKRLLIGSVMLALSGGLAFAQSTSATVGIRSMGVAATVGRKSVADSATKLFRAPIEDRSAFLTSLELCFNLGRTRKGKGQTTIASLAYARIHPTRIL
jgi:hypothetical protein